MKQTKEKGTVGGARKGMEVVGDHTFIYGYKMFKFDGNVFHEYDLIQGEWKLSGKKERPILVEIGKHRIALYKNGNVGVRVYVFSEYESADWNDYIAYPIMYDNGDVAWDNPYSVPNNVKERVVKIMKVMRQTGVL